MSYIDKVLSDLDAVKAEKLLRYEAAQEVTRVARADLDEVNDALTVIRLAKEEADRLKASPNDPVPQPVPVIEPVKSVATPAVAEVVKSDPVDPGLSPLLSGSAAQRLVDLLAFDFPILMQRHPKGLTTADLADMYQAPKARVAAAISHLKARGLVKMVIGGSEHPRFLSTQKANAA